MEDLSPKPLGEIVPSFAELVVMGQHKVLFSGEPATGNWISFSEAVFEEMDKTPKVWAPKRTCNIELWHISLNQKMTSS